jgi:hypothetical protein
MGGERAGSTARSHGAGAREPEEVRGRAIRSVGVRQGSVGWLGWIVRSR